MASSLRVLSGSLTRGSSVIALSEEDSKESVHTLSEFMYRQGKDIRTIDDLVIANGNKIRSNSSIKRTVSGRDINDNFFDDTLSPTKVSGSAAEFSSPSTAGRMGYRISHEIERRDLGQFSLYEQGIFEETVNPDNPVNVINIVDTGKKLPASLVDHSSLAAFDGRLDPLNIIKSLDRSLTDFPYPALGVKGAMQQVQDPFLHSGFVDDKFNVPHSNFVKTRFYLDAPENFGNVLIPAIMNFNRETIKPYVEVDNDASRDLNKTLKFTEDGNSDILNMLKTSDVSNDDSREVTDKMTTGGFVYSGETGTDSLTYGGLKK